MYIKHIDQSLPDITEGEAVEGAVGFTFMVPLPIATKLTLKINLTYMQCYSTGDFIQIFI